MATRINPFMQAHGASPGPGMRPLLTGMASGLIATLIASMVLIYSNAQYELAALMGSRLLILSEVLYGLGTGLIYGKVYQRAANDKRGGWLFGSSSGFFFWMVGPASIYLRLLGRPILMGQAALGLLGAQLLQGLWMGLLFPWVHQWVIRQNLKREKSPAFSSEEAAREMSRHYQIKRAFQD